MLRPYIECFVSNMMEISVENSLCGKLTNACGHYGSYNLKEMWSEKR